MTNSIIITCSPATFEEIQSHLLPTFQQEEEAAFAFAIPKNREQRLELSIIEWRPILDTEFSYKSAYHIEFEDSVRGDIIKRAHDLNAVLIELHSHLGKFPARFSGSDFMGFDEFVPHVMWRLPDRPYVALVFSKGSFDGLVWLPGNDESQSLNSIVTGQKQLIPTNLSQNRENEKPWNL